MRCLLCDRTTDPDEPLLVRGHVLARCPGCGIRRVDPLPDPQAVLGQYSLDYFQAGGQGYPGYLEDEAAHRATARTRLGGLVPFTAGGRLLDVGCAAGFFLDEARQGGFEAVGVEPCAEMAAVARERFGLDVRHASAEALPFPPGSFDVITLHQVLAHMRDPGQVLDRVRALLRPGGVVAIETWDAESPVARLAGARWPLYTPPTVLNAFGRTSLPRLLAARGLPVRGVRHGGKAISLTHGLSVLRSKYPALAPLEALEGRAMAQRIRVPFGFGQLLTVWAG